MNKPDTLIITPTLGMRDSLYRTIESVQKYGGTRVKHMLVAPVSVHENLKIKFPNIEIIAEPLQCKSIYSALDYSFKKYANNFKYIGYINDDDYWLLGFRQLFRTLETCSDVGVVYGRVNFVDDNNNIIYSQVSSPFYKAFSKLLLSKIVMFTQQATLMRVSTYFIIGGFDTTYQLVADTKFWVQAIEHGIKFKYINEICAAYTLQANQLSANDTLQNSEHKRLKNELPNFNKFVIFYEKIIFRSLNSLKYIKRLINN